VAVQAEYGAQQGALAGAVGAGDGEMLTGAEFEAHPIDRQQLAVPAAHLGQT
jgi:hypothetical protein